MIVEAGTIAVGRVEENSVKVNQVQYTPMVQSSVTSNQGIVERNRTVVKLCKICYDYVKTTDTIGPRLEQNVDPFRDDWTSDRLYPVGFSRVREGLARSYRV